MKRYGFHGLSYEYIARVLPEHSARADGRVVVAHLGNGASMCGMVGRKSQVSTMGFTAVEGLMMGTRSGSLDPAVVGHVARASGQPAEKVLDALNKESGLLGRIIVAGVFDHVDEIHVAKVGTGGPSCAAAHHRALGGTALDWRDGEWVTRRAGSGRELCWFPDPIGGEDCYRAALADAVLLAPAFPGIARITARMGANRRDRITSRFPMLRPPHPEGGPGGARVEVRGQRLCVSEEEGALELYRLQHFGDFVLRVLLLRQCRA